jgi:hypothetical protein
VSAFTFEIRDMLSSLGAYLFGSEQPTRAEARLQELSKEYDVKLRGCGDHAFSSLSPVSDALAAAHAEIKQLKFLLASAPMIDAPTLLDARDRFKTLQSRFAYIHPKTMARYDFLWNKPVNGVVMCPGSPTKWVVLSAMPQGRVIYSPLPIPGIEKILAS